MQVSKGIKKVKYKIEILSLSQCYNWEMRIKQMEEFLIRTSEMSPQIKVTLTIIIELVENKTIIQT